MNEDTTPPVDVEAWWGATAKVTRERDELLRQLADANAIVARVEGLAKTWTDDFMMRDQTGDDRDDRSDARDDCAMAIRAALEEPS